MCYCSWQDIVVGAPQYFEKDGEIGGAVYVYVNKGGKWDQVKPTRIDGPKNSMFGLAVENLGDINQDGFQGRTCREVLPSPSLDTPIIVISLFVFTWQTFKSSTSLSDITGFCGLSVRLCSWSSV